MTETFLVLLLAPALVAVYAYVVYPAAVLLLSLGARRRSEPADPPEWPYVSFSVPVYNEAAQIGDVIDSLLALDYPPDRRQIVIVSDASDDGTDEIVAGYAEQGVELLRMPKRGGKTAGENAAAVRLRGEIVVNTDASIRILPDALKRLIRHFADPSVGVASGRDLSVSPGRDANVAEGGYVGYEMGVRALETRLGGIVGSSGCFYAIRTHLHSAPLPEHLSRDFASALVAQEHGYRAVSVDDAVCLVPRTSSLVQEFRRKVRTMSRGMETLLYKRHLLNPFRHGLFAWKLFSHKVCRWLVPPIAVLGVVGLAGLAVTELWARLLLVLTLGLLTAAVIGWHATKRGRPVPTGLGLVTSAIAANVAVLSAIPRALGGDENAAWEPTRREPIGRPVPGPQGLRR